MFNPQFLDLTMKNDEVKVCYEEACVSAKGATGRLLAWSACILLVCVGISAINRSINCRTKNY